MILITSYYPESNINRKKELLDCIKNNLDNPLISEVHIISEIELPTISSPKLQCIFTLERWTFKSLLKYANNLKTDKIIILANTDIYFNYTIFSAKKIKKYDVYALTRWNYEDESNLVFYANFKSQDAWIFKGKLPEDIGDYYMGLPGCDNRFAYELKSKGYKLLNPSFSIQAIHMHRTNLRNYDKIVDRVNGEYYYPLPIGLNQLKEPNLKLIYLVIRRKYFSAIVSKSLEGLDYTIFGNMIARIMELYYKFRIKAYGK
jgi:hypothetical protein